MQTFHHRCELPAAADEVIKVITTREYLMFRYEDPELHHLHIEIEQKDEQGFACTVSRSGSSDKLPGFVRKIVGDSLTLIQKQNWRGWTAPIPGTALLKVEGVPGEITVDLVLKDTAAGQSVMEAEGHVKVNVPLIGGRIEKMLLGRAEEGFGKSMDAISDYVRQHCE